MASLVCRVLTRRCSGTPHSTRNTSLREAQQWIRVTHCYHTQAKWQRRSGPDTFHTHSTSSLLSTCGLVPASSVFITPTQRHMGSFSEVFRNVFTVKASDLQTDEHISSISTSTLGLDSTSAPGLDSIPSPGLDSTTAPSLDGTLAPGLDSTSAPGLDGISALGLDSIPAPGLDSISAAGLDSTSAPGLDSISAFQPVLDTTSAPAAGLDSTSVNATSGPQSLIDSIEYIPPPPVPPETAETLLNALGEPTFQSVGLGGWSPVGLIQSGFEFMHVSMNLPWWGTIAIATVILRTLIFPMVVISQRNAAKMNNHLPQLQVLQIKMTEARNAGDQLNAARYSQEMVRYMQENNVSPMKNMIVPLVQAPIFISMFMALRKMANLPVESFKEGGLWWFSDLTLADPFYLLPIITSVTMLATIELGTDGARMSSQNMQVMKYVLRGIPIVIFPFTMNFPAAVLCYWVSTNFFSLVQVGFLRVPAIRDYFNIERLITHKPESLPQKKKGAVEGFKESWRNMKISREISERQQYDEMRFKRSGSGPIVRTYKHNPTKMINVQAKVKGK